MRACVRACVRACADGHAQPAVGYGYESIGALSIHVPLAEAAFSLVPLSALVGDLPGSTLASTYEVSMACGGEGHGAELKPPCLSRCLQQGSLYPTTSKISS